MVEKIEKYTIKTTTEISIVRKKIEQLFKDNNHFFKGHFIGSFVNDGFKGSTSYNTNITISGKLTQHNENTIVSIKLLDDSPNYSLITNTLLIVFLIVTLMIIAVNKSTDIITYLIPIIIFFLAFIYLKIKRKISISLNPKLIDSVNLIAKELNGKVSKVD